MTSKEMLDIEKGLRWTKDSYNKSKVAVVAKGKDKLSGRDRTRQHVSLSVRRKGAGGGPEGPCVYYEHYSTELSALGAELEAKLKAREDGYIHWATLDNCRVEI